MVQVTGRSTVSPNYYTSMATGVQTRWGKHGTIIGQRRKRNRGSITANKLAHLSLEQALGFGVVLLPHAREDVAHDVLRDHHDLIDLSD